MAHVTNFDASNRADFIVEYSATDIETGEAIDFTGAEIECEIKDARCKIFEATIGDGVTILIDPTIIQIWFTSEQMNRLCAGSYDIGCIYTLNNITVQLFVGTIAVYDGIAKR